MRVTTLLFINKFHASDYYIPPNYTCSLKGVVLGGVEGWRQGAVLGVGRGSETGMANGWG